MVVSLVYLAHNSHTKHECEKNVKHNTLTPHQVCSTSVPIWQNTPQLMNKTKWVLVEIAQKHNFLPYTIRYKHTAKPLSTI
jgi:hypothetical protein